MSKKKKRRLDVVNDNSVVVNNKKIGTTTTVRSKTPATTTTLQQPIAAAKTTTTTTTNDDSATTTTAKTKKKKKTNLSGTLAASSSSSIATTTSRTHDTMMMTTKKRYLTVTDHELYQQVLREHYVPSGFVLLPAAASARIPSNNNNSSYNIHIEGKQALDKLRHAGYYHYDMVMAGGKHLSRTFVQRTLVGIPGITYKYLGLRLFAHAWSGPNCSDLFRPIYHLNQYMIHITTQAQQQQQQSNSSSSSSITTTTMGSCQYNLTLINSMEPSSSTNELRDEEQYGMGKASVSWHADSSVQDNSCIAVYHTVENSSKHKSGASGAAGDGCWKIALRPNPETDRKSITSNSTTESSSLAIPPPIVVPTKTDDIYLLLNEFNHTHQHMVLAASHGTHRISSTHRVAVTDTDTYDYISQQCSAALLTTKHELKQQISDQQRQHNNNNNNKHTISSDTVAILLNSQKVLTEVEFEWIAQYWVQGSKHDVQHIWWQQPIRALEQAWNALEKVTYKIYTLILQEMQPEQIQQHPQQQQQQYDDSIQPSTATATSSSSSTAATTTTAAVSFRELVVGFIAALKTRQELRMKWDERRADKIYKRRIKDRAFHPVEHPIFPPTSSSDVGTSEDTTPVSTKRLPKDLSNAIETLSSVLQNLDQRNHHSNNHTTIHTKKQNNKKRKKRPMNDDLVQRHGLATDGRQQQSFSLQKQRHPSPQHNNVSAIPRNVQDNNNNSNNNNNTMSRKKRKH